MLDAFDEGLEILFDSFERWLKDRKLDARVRKTTGSERNREEDDEALLELHVLKLISSLLRSL